MQPGGRTMIKRLILTAALVVAVVVVVLLVGGGGDSSGYRIRAIFDNGAFMVNGEQVRVAGANVGTIESVAVTRPGETVKYENGKPVSVPGKAIIVMDIADPSFQDFRSDATCLIRPQSLIGEKFVDCRPTLPRAPGSPPAPPLKQIESGQPGAGEYLLPLGNNGTSVDPDLINDIQTLPYAQRFRLIFNELGAGLAGRGEDLEVLVKRANPVLRDVDRLFGILSAQRHQLAQLASDSEAILGPLSRERSHVAGFIANSGAAAEASSERGAQLEESLRKFPKFLTEFRLTMNSLQGFSDAAAPVFEDLNVAAPSLTDATRTLTPFSQATTVALKSLGNAGEASGPIFAEADPVVIKARELARSGVSSTTELAKLTTNIKQTGGWTGLVKLIYNTAGALNGFDQYGHFGRTHVALTNCLQYSFLAEGESGCVSRFNGRNSSEGGEFSTSSLLKLLAHQQEEKTGGTSADSAPATGVGQAGAVGGDPSLGEASKTGGTAPLLDYLLGP
jgi:phospholipid/cholesterol/gamma-HCH transport system substrate-binding protein